MYTHRHTDTHTRTSFKKVSLLFTILVSFFSIGQITSISCGAEPHEHETIPSAFYSRSTNVATLANPDEKYVFSIAFHIIRDSDGTDNSPIAIGEDQLMNVIFHLNTTYNQHNIFFKYLGFDYIDNTIFTTINNNNDGVNRVNSRTNMVNYAISGGNYNHEALNMFIPYTTSLNGGLSYGLNVIHAFADLPGINSFIPRSAFQYPNYLKNTVPHEIGHNFNLYHTFHPHPNGTDTVSSCAANIERVTRYPWDDGYNADVAGDFVIDTPATYQLSSTDVSSCVFSNSSVSDCNGTLYSSNPPLVRNFMGYMAGSCFLNTFTPGQIVRARETIAASETALPSTNLGKLFLARNTIESLYEPYKLEPITAGIISITDDSKANGMSIVCRRLQGYIFKYQKGFTYTFNRYGTITNNSTSQIPSYQDFGSFVIAELDSTYEHFFGNTCYIGAQICQLEPITGGKLVTTPIIGSNNINVTNLTTADIENPDLINNLPIQTYNIIIKETTTGETNQQIIYKTE